MEAVFFDFDGVVLDSVDLKTDAFADMYADYGQDFQQQVVAYHLANGGVSRFEKFRYYHETLLDVCMTDELMAELCDSFNKRVFHRVLDAPFIDGVLETLRSLQKHNIPCFVASGTPSNELHNIVEERGLFHFFQEAHGSPRTKQEIVQDICLRHGLNPKRCLFIGDALTDFDAARSLSMAFLGVTARNNPFPKGTSVVSIPDFSALQNASRLHIKE
ncbi:MAG: HAD-IA family hydrolase [Desulfobacula sp.]|nr:HAD-IA family hydrolase [Desulfobacula sp.]